MNIHVSAELNRRFDRNTSAIILLALTIFAAGIFHIAQRTFALADQLEYSSEHYGKGSFISGQRPTGATIDTNYGVFTIQFLYGHATTTIQKFATLSKGGFYSGTKFHRVVREKYIQGGDPLTRTSTDESVWGMGTPGYTFADEINAVALSRGIVAMANTGPNTNGSQFFIVVARSLPELQGRHTVFARVTKGLSIIDAINEVPVKTNGIPKEGVVVNSIQILY